ncbi:MAG: NDP-sugar synthase, partial [Candidatus Eremiobacteraeota bacterium]|nr:NDP-sugar synthase [Candidatus Eremiobacteraeota bacterium]
YAYTTADYWIDLGRPEHYLSAHRAVLDGSMPLTLAPGINGPGAGGAESATIVAPVYLDRGVVLGPAATIGPHAVLGKGCRVGPGAIVRGSVLWDDVIVEEGALIEESIIASRTRVGKNARIGRGSVIGHDVSIAEGTVAEPGSRIGASAPVSTAGK